MLIRYSSALLVMCCAFGARAQVLLWAAQFGSDRGDFAKGLARDGEGSFVVAGETQGSLGGPNQGKADIWLGRLDSSGDQIWIKQIGSPQDDFGGFLVADGGGGSFAAGDTFGSLAGPNQGGSDAWLARFDAGGGESWLIQLGSSANDPLRACASDGEGGAYIAGVTEGNLGGPFLGGFGDAWLARVNGSGHQAWITQFGTAKWESARALCSDGVGGTFVAGDTVGNLGGPHQGFEDAWLARYDAVGNQAWVLQFGTSEADWASALASDDNGGAFLAGVTLGELGGPARGKEDAWLARYDPSGKRLWITQFGTADRDEVTALASDGAGGTFVAGLTEGGIAGPNYGGIDAWLAHFDAAGDPTWITQIGTPEGDDANAVALDSVGAVYVAGGTGGNLGGQAQGSGDAWVARFDARLACYADFDANGTLDLFDFLAFVNAFNAGEDIANCDGEGGLDLFDFLCYTNAFNAGC